MAFFDNLKEKAAGLADALGLDNQAADVLGDLVEKLEELKKEDRLDDIAQSALTAFKPALKKFKMDQVDLEGLLKQAKPFVEKLSKADLPGDLEKVLAKVHLLLK